jgi:general secretion pathway protein J
MDRAPTRSHRRSAGFTLVEVLIATALLSVMALIAWRGLDAMQRSVTVSQEHSDEALALQAVLDQWRRDLDQMVALPAMQAIDWDGVAVRITRRDAVDAGSGVRVVAWARRGVDGAWRRWQSDPLRDRAEWASAWQQASVWARGDMRGLDDARTVRLGTVTDWRLFYFRNNAWTNPLSSADTPAAGTAPTAAAPLVPEGVRLVVQLAAPRSLAGTITLDWVRPTLAPTRG